MIRIILYRVRTTAKSRWIECTIDSETAGRLPYLSKSENHDKDLFNCCSQVSVTLPNLTSAQECLSEVIQQRQCSAKSRCPLLIRKALICSHCWDLYDSLSAQQIVCWRKTDPERPVLPITRLDAHCNDRCVSGPVSRRWGRPDCFFHLDKASP